MFKKLRSEVNVVTIIGIFVVVIMLLTILPGLTVNFSGGGTPISVTIGANTYVIATSADAQAIIDADAWNGVDGVYVDSVNGVAGVASPIGTPGDPSSNLTDALTIAAARKVNKVYLVNINDSFIVPHAISDIVFVGTSFGLYSPFVDLNNQGVIRCSFQHIQVSGINNSVGESVTVEDGLITGETGDIILTNGWFRNITVRADESVEINNSFGDGGSLDLTSLNEVCEFFGVSGYCTISNLGGGTVNIFGNGLFLTLVAGCTGGTINIYGDVKITNNAAGTTVNDYTATTQTDELYQNAHSVQQVAPDNAAGVTLTSGAAPWTLGAFATIIAANSDASGGTEKFDIHGLDVEDASANAKYEIVLYGTVGGVADTVIGHATFTRTNATTVSRSTTMMTPQVDKGSPIKAKLESSTGAGTETCDVKVWYHNYK